MFIFWKYNTPLAVPWVFISAILLILRWVHGFNRRLIFRKFVLISMELIIILYYLLLHASHSINLGSAIIILIRQKVRWLIILGWNLLLTLLLLVLFISVLLLLKLLTVCIGSKLNLTTILNYYILWLYV